jgi:glycosyltransferase involved in cell wall biosynthesis
MPTVSMFLNRCLPLSCIFIYHQMSALTRYQAEVLACRIESSPVPMEAFEPYALNRTNSIPDRAKEAVFKATGYAPGFVGRAKETDLIHAHFGPTGWLAMPVARKANVPLVITLHGFDVLKRTIDRKADGPLQALYGQQRHKLADAATSFICVSEYIKKRAIEFGFPEEKCVVHYMGIPLLQAPGTSGEQQKNSPIRLLAVGRLVPFKGHTKLIEAVSAAEQAGYDVQLDIIGDGPLRQQLESQAEQSLRRCTFHGAKPHDYVLSLMRQSDIFCHTSMHQPNGQTEAFGLVLLEAQWAGLPVVAFSSGGVPEAIADNKTGILCPEGDVQQFKQALCALLKDKAKLRHMAAEAPEFVRKHFDNARQTPKLETLYDQAVAGFAFE